VDDHQVRFSTWLGRDPAFEVVGDDEGRFRGLLERAVVDSDAFHTTAPAPDVRASAKRFEQLVNGLFTVRLDRCG